MTRKSKSIGSALLILFAPIALAAPPLSGAIFTTTEDGCVVNGNTIYNAKEEVFLDGGPPLNAPVTAASLPDGEYYFQVTDPSGKKLLSTDDVSARRFTVVGGVITSVDTHVSGNKTCNGATSGLTVQLFPFDDTPNNGGVYKAWATPVSDLVPANECRNGCFHGFLPAASKTDNFKVADKTPNWCLDIDKIIIDKNTQVLAVGWEATVIDPLGTSTTIFTNPDSSEPELCGLTGGTYIVTESLVDARPGTEGDEYTVIQTLINGEEIEPSTTVVINWSPGKDPEQKIVWTNEFVCDAKDCK